MNEHCLSEALELEGGLVLSKICNVRASIDEMSPTDARMWIDEQEKDLAVSQPSTASQCDLNSAADH